MIRETLQQSHILSLRDVQAILECACQRIEDMDCVVDDEGWHLYTANDVMAAVANSVEHAIKQELELMTERHY